MLDQTTLIFSVYDLDRGKWEKFSLDMLITLAARVGQKPSLVLKAA